MEKMTEKKKTKKKKYKQKNDNKEKQRNDASFFHRCVFLTNRPTDQRTDIAGSRVAKHATNKVIIIDQSGTEALDSSKKTYND